MLFLLYFLLFNYGCIFLIAFVRFLDSRRSRRGGGDRAAQGAAHVAAGRVDRCRHSDVLLLGQPRKLFFYLSLVTLCFVSYFLFCSLHFAFISNARLSSLFSPLPLFLISLSSEISLFLIYISSKIISTYSSSMGIFYIYFGI